MGLFGVDGEPESTPALSHAGAPGFAHRRGEWVHVCGLIAVCGLLFAPMIFEGKVLFWADYFLQFYPFHQFARESFWHNSIPLWNPYTSGGMAFLGNLQSAVFYPLNAVFLIVPVHFGFGISALLHVALFGLFTYLLLRQWQVSKFGAFCGAATLMLSGFTVCRIEYPTILGAAVWLPLQLLLVDRIRYGCRRSMLAFPLAVAVQLFAGHLQIAMMSLTVVFAYSLFIAPTCNACDGEAKGQARDGSCVADSAAGKHRGTLPAVAFGILVGTLLSLPQLLPTLDCLRHSTRSDTTFRFASVYSLPPWQLLTFLFPNAFGNPTHSFFWGDANFWELTVYTGLLGWLAVPIAVAHRQRTARFFLGVCVLSLLLAFGKFTPIYGALYRWLPGFQSFKGPGRFLYLYAFSISLLAGFGYHRLGQACDQTLRRFLRWTFRLLTVVTGVLCALIVGRNYLLSVVANFLRWQFPRIEATATSDQFSRLAEGVMAIWLQDLLVAVALLGLLLIFTRRRLDGRVSLSAWKGIVACLICADLLLFAYNVNPWTDASLYTRKAAVGRFLQQQPGDFHILTRPSLLLHAWGKWVPFTRPASTQPSKLVGLSESLAPNLPARYHLRDLEGYDPLKPKRSVERVQAINRQLDVDKETTLLTQADVRFVVGYKENLQVPGLRRIYDRDGVEVYENGNWRPAIPTSAPGEVYFPVSFKVGLFIGLVTWAFWLAAACHSFNRRERQGREG